jgi:hypothetical protein
VARRHRRRPARLARRHGRAPNALATAAGIQPDDDLAERFAVGGTIVTGVPARVLMRVGSGDQAHAWEAPVWFCDPWPFGFQLLGLEGFLQHFRVTLSAYHEWIDCKPES